MRIQISDVAFLPHPSVPVGAGLGGASPGHILIVTVGVNIARCRHCSVPAVAGHECRGVSVQKMFICQDGGWRLPVMKINVIILNRLLDQIPLIESSLIKLSVQRRILRILLRRVGPGVARVTRPGVTGPAAAPGDRGHR